MIKILLCGSSGQMGQTVYNNLPKDIEVVAGVSQPAEMNSPFPVYEKIEEVKEAVDVILDFSHFSLLDQVLEYAVKHKVPIVIATTGLTDEAHKKISEASKLIPIVQSGNYSFGVHALMKAVELLTETLDEADIEIIEKHHHFKKDAPSGTAELLFESIKEVRPTVYEHYGREKDDAARSLDEIGIHSIRGGTYPGEHSVIFALEDEVIEITHHAFSKKIFSNGSIKAIRFIIQQKPGRYNLEDVVNHD